jgi:hypothetical protein
MKAAKVAPFFLDQIEIPVHDDSGSKRFEGQRAWREVADPERPVALAIRNYSSVKGSDGRSGNPLGKLLCEKAGWAH